MRCALEFLIVTMFFCLGSLACHKSPTDQDDTDAQLKAATESAETIPAFAECSVTAYTAAQMIPNTLAKSAVVLGDTLLPNLWSCPYLVWDKTSKNLVLDYGEGCTSNDGQNHSGSIDIHYSGNVQSGATLTLSFTNYKVDDRTLTGNVSISTQDNAYSLTVQDGVISQESGTTKIDAELQVETKNTGDKDTSNDMYLMSGVGTVVDSEGNSYNFSITQPIKVVLDCQYPLEGKVLLTAGNDFSAKVDYYPQSGACDDVVSIKIGNITKTVHLTGEE